MQTHLHYFSYSIEHFDIQVRRHMRSYKLLKMVHLFGPLCIFMLRSHLFIICLKTVVGANDLS